MNEGAARKRILVVDDDAKILRFICSSLRLAGHDVLTASGGKEALKTIECQKPDMVVLDIFMPEMDGFEVLTQLRSSCQVPVITVSAQTSVAQKALEFGANDFVAKPFRPEDLLHRIRTLLNQAG